jgi:DNA-binding transcriptional ArsR family regulator
MVDAWLQMLALMNGTYAAPAVRWPPERCRIVAPADHAEPELVNDATDAQVADYVALSGSMTATDLAAAMRVTRQAADQRLQKLARAGLVRRVGREWCPTVGLRIEFEHRPDLKRPVRGRPLARGAARAT